MSNYGDIPQASLRGYVGFDTLPTQINKKLIKRGFQLNVILVGETGLGKSTLVNTLFASHLIDSKGRTAPEESPRQTVEIQAVSHMVNENGVKLRLTIVDTPGFGDHVNNEGCWDPIVKYIKDQHAIYLRKELTATRERFVQDTRIHCCLFFIAPTGHALKPIDILVLQKLTEVVNVVPVIAKSDSMTPDEREAFKQRVRSELEYHNIRLFPFVDEESEETDPEEIRLNQEIRERVPFAIVGSERTITVGGKEVIGRKNRWGGINVEDPTHCEFIHLRDFLTRTHLQDLIETTAHIHYESFRTKQLLALKESNARPHLTSVQPLVPPMDRLNRVFPDIVP
ncbi:cdc 10 like protein [Piptocephalis cylindrospora]|uniref:Cdc 10 like protein n=1 Tax=Piptocephalis cylindrospora TaxID=1907219 RepID=A0A4P9Y4A3_9FUNG|nr:cdc 10 like protein [Piptocephalis cylindrospora]|eukprot:RKP13767.1 cdc 10 like protein [Piptocephalis cylindrospora]